MIPLAVPSGIEGEMHSFLEKLLVRCVDIGIVPFLIEYTTGTIRFRSRTNSTTAFRFQNAAGTNILTIDTTNNRIIINTSGNSLVVTSPNGTQYYIGVDNDGALTATPV